MKRISIVTLIALVLMLGLIAAPATAQETLELGNVDGIWGVIDEGQGALEGASCDRWATGPGDSPTQTSDDDASIQSFGGLTTDENQVRYGTDGTGGPCHPFADQSGLGFDGSNGGTITSGEQFELGVLTHYNNPINAANRFTEVELDITLEFTDPAQTITFEYTVELDETANRPCPFPGCDDIVKFSSEIPDQEFEIDGVYYTLEILGFIPDCDPNGTPVEQFFTKERQDNTACLYAMITVSRPAIDIEKSTNGQDADDPTGPMIPVGAPVTWEYVVTNTGNVELMNVAVTDNQGVTVICPQTTLAVGESMTCTVSGVAVAGQYGNIGTATGTPLEGEPVSDTDPSHYFGVDASITIEKSTNGQDADDPMGPMIALGDPVSWVYVVTNTGNVELTNVAVEDSQGVACNCPADTLQPGESMTCTASGLAVAGQYGNIGTATGNPPAGPAVSDTDPSHYFGVDASIAIEKSTNGQDADDPTGPMIAVGDTVNWQYVVSNTGNVDLTGIVVADDQGVVVSCPASSLAAGASMTCTASGLAQAGQYANMGTATGNPPAGPQVTDSDPSHYFGVGNASICIEKSSNGHDADTPTGPMILKGDPVIWEYVVTNTGDVPLSSVTVSDSMGVAVSCPATSLVPGASMTCMASGVAIAGQYVNTGTATGTTPTGEMVHDNDPSHYFGVEPELSIEKTVDFDQDGIYSDAETSLAGSTASWKIVVTNTGNVPVFNVQVTDDNGKFFGPISLAVGASETFMYDTTVDVDTENQACADGVDELGAQVGPVCDSATVTVTSGEVCVYPYEYWKTHSGLECPDECSHDCGGGWFGWGGKCCDDDDDGCCNDDEGWGHGFGDKCGDNHGGWFGWGDRCCDDDDGCCDDDEGCGHGCGDKCGDDDGYQHQWGWGFGDKCCDDDDGCCDDDEGCGHRCGDKCSDDQCGWFGWGCCDDRCPPGCNWECEERYDDTWDKLLPNGPKTPFFNTGYTYHEILCMSSSCGNTYVSLAHQYIAAELNGLMNGALPDDIQDIVDKSAILLEKYQGSMDIPEGSVDRFWAIHYACVLKSFNNGEYPGWPLCDDPCECECVCDEECGECKGKVTELTLQYNGAKASLITVEQKKGGVVFNDDVNPGKHFSFVGTSGKTHKTLGTEIKVYVDGILNAKIHTSCSQPIGPGLVRGDFEVVSGYSRIGGELCPVEDPCGDDGCCGECDDDDGCGHGCDDGDGCWPDWDWGDKCGDDGCWPDWDWGKKCDGDDGCGDKCDDDDDDDD